MSKVTLLRIVNSLLLLAFLVQAATGIIFSLEIHVPAMELLSEIHEYVGLLMVVLVIAHLSLNWGWVKANIFKKWQPPV